MNIRPGCESAEVPVERLHEVLALDRNDGRLTWRLSRGRSGAGQVAGCIKNDAPPGKNRREYRVVRVDGVGLLAHRVVIAMLTGSWPADEVDHIDGDGLNNAPSNLRVVSRAINAQNQTRPYANNEASLRGVSRQGKKWRARLYSDGKERLIGLYDTKEQAHSAYLTQKQNAHLVGLVREVR